MSNKLIGTVKKVAREKNDESVRNKKNKKKIEIELNPEVDTLAPNR